MDNLTSFTTNFNPYRNKYIYKNQQNDLFENSWHTSEHYLTDNMINNALNGLTLYGYFLTNCPNIFGLDIDDHTHKGEGYLLSVLDNIKKAFNFQNPSMLVRSPNGLHAYYKLQYPVPFSILEEKLKLKLYGIPVEIKPTTKTGIRIPNKANFLDPETLLPCTKNFTDILENAEIYHNSVLFDETTPEDIRESLKTRKVKSLRLYESVKLAKIESDYPCIYDGNTNDALCNLIPIYRSTGMTAEESAQRFYSLLAPVYNGELRNYNRLLSRVQSFFRKDTGQLYRIIKPRYVQRDFVSEELAETLVNRVTGATATKQERGALVKKKRTVFNAVMRLQNWKMYLDNIKNDKQQCQTWNYLYPFFIKNMNEGFYPIPRNLLKEIHEHYELWLLPFLVEQGYLKKSPYGYSADNGTCFHYEIRQEVGH